MGFGTARASRKSGAMGQSISSISDMVSYAGELRRAAKRTPEPALANKISRSAAELEKAAIARVTGAAAPRLGSLLDKIV